MITLVIGIILLRIIGIILRISLIIRLISLMSLRLVIRRIIAILWRRIKVLLHTWVLHLRIKRRMHIGTIRIAISWIKTFLRLFNYFLLNLSNIINIYFLALPVSNMSKLLIVIFSISTGLLISNFSVVNIFLLAK